MGKQEMGVSNLIRACVDLRSSCGPWGGHMTSVGAFEMSNVVLYCLFTRSYIVVPSHGAGEAGHRRGC